jgi:subtilase family serine protease
LQGNVHPLARPEFDKGVLDDAQPATRALILLQRSPDQETALRQLLDDQQNKSSVNYHAWLTPEQFGKQFGPADSDVQAVTQWLTTHGFQNIKVGAGKTVVEFSGNVGQMREAFHTGIHKFQIRGEMRNANVSDPQIPAALAPVVSGVVGLTNFRPRAHVHQVGTFRKTKATGEVKPLFTFAGCGTSGTQPCFAVGPGDLAKIYSIPTTVKGAAPGAGQTIVVVNDSNINPQDLVDYRNIFGLPALTLAQVTNNIIVNGPDPGINGDEEEADLDTQVASAVAPGAQVLLVITEQPDSGVGAAGVDLSVLYTINNNLAPVVSKSFGACEAFEGTSGNQLENALWEQASAQGITGLVSAGDNGSAACDPASSNFLDVSTFGLAVSGDASTPFNIAVGGTDFNSSLANYGTTFWGPNAASTQTSALGYVPEITWNESCASGGIGACTAAVINNDSAGLSFTGPDLVAGAGGASNCSNSTSANGSITCNSGYPKPSWQTGAGVPSDGARDLPDVSLFASNGVNGSFYIVCEQDANTGTGSSTSSCDLNSPFNDFQGVGGTSASSPAFAAIMALVNQQTGQRQGNANYVLYSLASKPGASCTSAPNPGANCIFYDIPAGSNNSVACLGGTFNCSNQSTAANQYGILVQANNVTPAFNTTAGFDLATGLGSVNVGNLLSNWTSAAFRPTTTAFSLNGGAAVNITHGLGVSVSGTVKPTSGTGTPTGFVELFTSLSPTQIIDTFPLSSGSYSGNTVMLPGGSAYTVGARYGGDGTFASSTALTTGAVTNVNKEPSVTAVNLVVFDSNGNPSFSSAASLTYGSPYILLVGVTNSSGNLCVPPPFGTSVPVFGSPLPCPTGTITLSDNGSPLKNFVVPNTNTPTNSAKLNNTGFAEDQPIQLSGGSHSLAATYAGDNSFMASNSAARALSISASPTATSVSASSTSIVAGATVTLTATVAGTQSNGAAPTGMVQFMNGATPLSTAVTCGSPVNFNNNTGAPPTCSATLTTTALSFLPPPATPFQAPRFRTLPMWLTALALLILFLLALQRIAPAKRRLYAYAGLLLFTCVAAGIAGCGGGGGGGGGNSHVDNVTAVFTTGDANYSSSTSGALGITVQ